MRTELEVGFGVLFAGRTDAYGTDSGGCERVDAAQHRWPGIWRRHLDGTTPIGVYPMRPIAQVPSAVEWCVRWGCVDLDVKTEGKSAWDYSTEDDAHDNAANLQGVLRAFGVTGWIERTRSGGRHVWIFCEGWVPASVMRRSLLVCCGVASVSTREVNPKQEILSEGQLGNYVRLPYPGGGAPLRQAMIPDGYSPIGVEYFIERALVTRATTDALERIAAKWTAPERVQPVILQTPVFEEANELLPRLNAPGRRVFLDGPENGDRSNALVYVAHQAKLSELSPSEALVLILDCDYRWGKFTQRPDRAKRLWEIIDRAWR